MHNQITITDPNDLIKSRLHTLKEQYDINVAAFCRVAVDEKINAFAKQFSSSTTKN
jgi:hypothetical protein